MPKHVERDPQDEIVRLLVLELRRTLENQSQAIFELNRAGFSQSRIAELLGTTPGTVNVALQRLKKRAPKEE